jgi:SAM-dependent methyltransferase
MPKHLKPNYAEFSNPKLAAIYNAVNAHYSIEKQFYLNFASEIKAKKIIDLGCGTGLLTLSLAGLGYEMIGVEPAKAMLDIAKQSLDADKVKWIEGDVFASNEENADLAIMTAHVAQFLLEDEYFLNCLRKINTSLKDGGYLVFDSRNTAIKFTDLGWPTKDNPREKEDHILGKMHWWAKILEMKGNRVIYEIHHLMLSSQEESVSVNELIFRTQEEIVDFLQKAGFKVDKIYGDWDKSEVVETSPEFIFMVRKN